jgi:arylsulfatase
MTTNPKRPNILWICTDQQRFDSLGCYGNPWVTTPHIDQLAASGILLEQCACQNPVCTPSRTSFLTGRYPSTTRCRDNGQSIPATEVLVTKLLADAGYTCGLSGKLHLSACHVSVCKETERRIDDGYSVFHWSHQPGPQGNDNQYIAWLMEQGVEYSTPPLKECKYVDEGMPSHLHHTTWCADRAIDFIKDQAGANQPWLFSVNIYDPHHPFDPPAEFLDRYREILDQIPLPNYTEGELANKPERQQLRFYGREGRPNAIAYARMTSADHRWLKAAYWAMCDHIDVQVGKMINALEQTGQMENTIVIYMADHGEMLGDHGIYLKGPFFYEPLVHVPLIISYPGTIRGGQRSQALVELVDLAPTLLAACGIEPYPAMQGRSLWPLLMGQAPLHEHRDDVYCQMYSSFDPIDNRGHADMIRTREYKLAVDHKTDQGELYDLCNDPTETHNRWDDPNYLTVKAQMLTRLTHRLAFTVDPLPPHEAPW